jgi:hypothetical protein
LIISNGFTFNFDKNFNKNSLNINSFIPNKKFRNQHSKSEIKNPTFAPIKHLTMSVNKEVKRITTHILQEMKNRGEKIAMLTAYDFSMATIVDDAGTDIILVGDSASNVMAGHETTLPITLDQMIYHASSVVRAANGHW